MTTSCPINPVPPRINRVLFMIVLLSHFTASIQIRLQSSPAHCRVQNYCTSLQAFYVTNSAVLSFVKRFEKDALQCLGILCGRNQHSKTTSTPFSGQQLALILAET